MKCELSNASIHYEMYGEGRPIIFLHALSLDFQSMKNVFEPLFTSRLGWKRIYVDLPGMGESKAENWMKSSDDILAVILKFIDSILCSYLQ
ncbi:alpha/beta fold hydrolase [Cohnella suwonensis]|uniref:Alpha/beta fold hydrolase n=1 Tax=Cohnella suwonensis TaxID=696072 RepID=A0ABW0LVE6_9BACL